MGISEEDQQHLFTRFFRSTAATEQAIQGTGLGLSIVHSIVTQHGGAVSIDSAPGRGTTVTVLLPYGAAEPATATRHAAAPLAREQRLHQRGEVLPGLLDVEPLLATQLVPHAHVERRREESDQRGRGCGPVPLASCGANTRRHEGAGGSRDRPPRPGSSSGRPRCQAPGS